VNNGTIQERRKYLYGLSDMRKNNIIKNKYLGPLFRQNHIIDRDQFICV